MDKEMLVIVGRKWFDKTYGNTYFTAMAYFRGKSYDIPYQYGYSDQYKYETMLELEKQGVLPTPIERYKNGGTEAPWQYCERNNIKLFTNDVYVARKKDL